MRALTTSFLFFGYLFLAMTVGAFLWRAGFGVGAGVAATLGTFALFGAVHLYIDGFGQRAALRKEIEQVREAHRLLADAMESTQGALTELAQAIESGAVTSNEALSGEVRMLETLIQQMSESIDERLAATPVAPVQDKIGLILLPPDQPALVAIQTNLQRVLFAGAHLAGDQYALGLGV